MISLFGKETRDAPDLTLPGSWGRWGALLVFVASFTVGIFQTNASRSSTAAVGYFFLPFASAIVALPGFALGWCFGYFLAWRRSSVRLRRWSAFGAAAIPAFATIWTGLAFGSAVETRRQVDQVQAMNAAELQTAVDRPVLKLRLPVLRAIASNPRVMASTLHRVATISLPFSRDGEAVRRAIAVNPNTDGADLNLMASSDDNVLIAVAANPKTPEAMLRRLAKRGGSMIERGLRRNPNTPSDVLEYLNTQSGRTAR